MRFRGHGLADPAPVFVANVVDFLTGLCVAAAPEWLRLTGLSKVELQLPALPCHEFVQRIHLFVELRVDDCLEGGRVTFRLEDGRTLDLAPGDPQLRHVDRAWASTVHAFQGRTVDTVIAATEANHPHLTTQKSFYVEIYRARDRAELVTDDRAALKEQLEAATGKRIAALEAVEPDKAKGRAAGLDADGSAGRESDASVSRERDRSPEPEMERSRAPKSVDRDLGL